MISHWPWLSASVVVAVLLAGAGALVVRDVRRSREHRTELAERERRAQVGLRAVSAPTAPVVGGRHTAPGFAAYGGNAGRHFADDSPTREIRRDWSWRA